MPVKHFIDTNIFVYCFDRTKPAKQVRALSLVDKALSDHSGSISYQVVQEFLNVASRKFQPPMSRAEAWRYVEIVLGPLCEIYASLPLYQEALSIRDETGYSFCDALIVAAAAAANCRFVYSEDLQDSRVVRGLEIRNPFAH